jgi:hypothetical protein
MKTFPSCLVCLCLMSHGMNELFQDDPAASGAASAMQGGLVVSGEGASVPAVTLRQMRIQHPVPVQVPVLTTLPVIQRAASSPEDEGWTLVWADEFEGTVLDPGKWEHQIGTGASEGLQNWGDGTRGPRAGDPPWNPSLRRHLAGQKTGHRLRAGLPADRGEWGRVNGGERLYLKS